MKSKRLLSALLSAALVISLLAGMPLTASAEGAEALRAKIETNAHAGSGSLTASVSGNVVTVTGTVTGVSKALNLNIDSGVTVVWMADYSGSANPMIGLTGSGTFEVAKGGVLKNSSVGFTVLAEGSSNLHVNGGTVSGTGLVVSSNTTSSVKVSDGLVDSVGNNQTISARGNVDVSGGTVRAAGSSAAIGAVNGNAITITGGLIQNTGTGVAIFSDNDGASVTITGGTVESMGRGQTISAGRDMTMSGGTVRNTGESAAIIITRNLNISGGTVSATQGPAIGSTGVNFNINLSGGFVFAYGKHIVRKTGDTISEGDYVINGGSGSVTIGGSAVVCAWNQAAGRKAYDAGTAADLNANSSAVWGIDGGVGNGISYTNGSNTGFFPISGITVTPSGSAPTPPPSTAPTPPPSQAPASDIKVIVNGSSLTFDQPPVIDAGSTLVPLRAIFEALGAAVEWDAPSQTITAVKGDVKITLKIGSKILTRNGVNITLNVPAQIIGGRTLVPVRAIAESFGSEVLWNPGTRTVTVTD